MHLAVFIWVGYLLGVSTIIRLILIEETMGIEIEIKGPPGNGGHYLDLVVDVVVPTAPRCC